MKQMQICCTLNDCNLQEREKSLVALLIFYKDFDKLPLESYQEAFEKCLWFVDGVKKKPENREKRTRTDRRGAGFPVHRGSRKSRLG